MDEVYQQASVQATVAGVEANEAYEHIVSIQVSSKEDVEFVASILQQVKSKIKSLEETRAWVTKPITESLERVRALFRPPLERLNECEGVLKGKISEAYYRAQREQQALLEQAATGNTEQHLAAAQAMDIGKVEGIQKRETWTYRVYDMNLVPREFLCIDHAKVLKIVKAQKENTDIPGIEPYADLTIAVTSR